MIRAGLIEGADSRELRRRVLRPHLSPTDPLPGDDRPDAVHIGAVNEGGVVVSTCLVQSEPCYWRDDADAARAWRLKQMATVPELRGCGYGALVVRAVAEYLVGIGVPLVWCHAREAAVPFYRGQGFSVYGDVFVEYPASDQPVPHVRMARELSPSVTSSG